MKTTVNFRTLTMGCAAMLMLGSAQLQAKPAAAKTPPLKGPAIKHAQDILGKPLTESQKKAVRAAQKARTEAMKPIQAKFKATVAKVLGLTVAQYEARDKALRDKNQKK